MNIEELIEEISKMKESELKQVSKIVHERYRQLETLRLMVFNVGDTVSWDSKRGMKVIGKITKINRTTANVTSNSGERWKVSPTLLVKV